MFTKSTGKYSIGVQWRYWIDKRRSRLRLGIGCLFALMLLQISVAQAGAFVLPTPTGPYKVGITQFHWVDSSRDETFTPDNSTDKREVMVDVWYPATVADGASPAPYMPEAAGVADGFEAVLGQDRLPLEFLSTEVSHSYAGAPLSDVQSAYPVVIFSHGYGGEDHDYTGQIEELASHGYVVVGINHPYIAAAVRLPDKGLVLVDTSDTSLFNQAAIMSADQRFVLDQLETLNGGNPDGMFKGQLDLDSVGLVGQSTGAAAAIVTFTVDSRFKAAISENGDYLPDAERKGSDRPLMQMAEEDAPINMTTFAHFTGPVYNLRFKTFGHLNFSDLAGWGVDGMPLVGTVDPARSMHVINAYVLAFFNHTLKGMDEPLLQGSSSDYPEVIFQTQGV